MLAASVSKRDRVGMSAPGLGSLDTRSDQLPNLGSQPAYGSSNRHIVTKSANMSQGFAAPPGRNAGMAATQSMSGKAGKSVNMRNK